MSSSYSDPVPEPISCDIDYPVSTFDECWVCKGSSRNADTAALHNKIAALEYNIKTLTEQLTEERKNSELLRNAVQQYRSELELQSTRVSSLGSKPMSSEPSTLIQGD